MKIIYYFLSGWMANLGVVPLFLFCAFLFWPLFFILFALFVSVIFVRDDIWMLLTRCSILLFKVRNLTNSETYVKGKFLNFFFLEKESFLLNTNRTVSIVFFILISFKSMAITPDLWIGQGEHKEIIPSLGIRNFTIGNPEILSYKIIGKDQKLLIKGKKTGHTEILIWNKNGEKISYSIFVLSRIKHQEMQDIAHQLSSDSLKVYPVGDSLWIEGKIEKIDTYVLLQKIKAKEKNRLWIRAEVSLEVKKWIIGEIYKGFLDQNIEFIKCWWEQSEILCHLPQGGKELEIVKHFEENYGVLFLKHQFNSPKNNFKLKFKIIQIENIVGEEIKTGLDQITGHLGELFKSGLTGILFKNPIALNLKDYNFSTLASPEIALSSNQNSTIEIGQEIPFESFSANNGKVINWKFAGLKISVKLLESSDYFKLEYETELSDGEINSTIKGNKGKSTVSLELNSPLELFQIELKTKSAKIDQMPFLSKIPLVGEIFKSKGNSETHKRITGVVLLEEMGIVK